MYRYINLLKYGLKEAINIEKYSSWEGLEANRHCYAPDSILKMVINAKDVKCIIISRNVKYFILSLQKECCIFRVGINILKWIPICLD